MIHIHIHMSDASYIYIAIPAIGPYVGHRTPVH